MDDQISGTFLSELELVESQKGDLWAVWTYTLLWFKLDYT